MIHRLNHHIAVSGALAAADIRHLATEGFGSIIDLRSDGDPRPQGIAPWDEGPLAAATGLAYRQVPVEPPQLGDGLGRTVRHALRELPPPVLLHCTTGRRAATFGLIALACDERLTVDECLARGRAMGLDFDGMPRLAAFLRAYVQRHGRYYAETGEERSDGCGGRR